MTTIYKICPAELWAAAEKDGLFRGAPVDLEDGYIHFSTAAQVAETAARHFKGQDGLLIVAIASERLGPALRFEPARSGDLFPHLYGPLDLKAVVSVLPLPLGPDGRHQFPVLAV
jgi:uncharacterized protein (DUF952 family)